MEIIFKTLFGSHLYGTDTPNSDKDYKAVFIQPIEDGFKGIGLWQWNRFLRYKFKRFMKNTRKTIKNTNKKLEIV